MRRGAENERRIAPLPGMPGARGFETVRDWEPWSKQGALIDVEMLQRVRTRIR